VGRHRSRGNDIAARPTRSRDILGTRPAPDRLAAMIVHTDRLVLRPVHRDDLEAVWAIHGDPGTNRYNPTGPLPSRMMSS
jgi:hypothetical protein